MLKPPPKTRTDLKYSTHKPNKGYNGYALKNEQQRKSIKNKLKYAIPNKKIATRKQN